MRTGARGVDVPAAPRSWLRRSSGGRTAGRIRRWVWRVPLLPAVLVLAVGSWGVGLGVTNNADKARAEAGRSAVAFVQDAVPRLLSYDVTSVRGLAAANASLMTTTFGAEYVTLVKTQLLPGVLRRSLTNQTKVVTTALIDASQSEVTLLLFLDQISGARGMATPVATGSRVRVTVDRVDGQWRIDRLDPV